MPHDDFIPDFHDESSAASSSPESHGEYPANLSWQPLKGGGTNLLTHKLKEISSDRVAFRPTVGGVMFGVAFALPGLAMLGFGLKGAILGGEPYEGRYILILAGLIFAVAGIFLIRSVTRRITFDQRKGYYWRGKLPANPTHSEEGHFVRLDDIVGLQLISEHISGSESSYHSYELNLVLHDGSRRNVVDHGKADRLAEDAQKLAFFLGVPVWDRR